MSDDERKIIISAKGIEITGKWKIGELLSAAQSLAAMVNDFEIKGQSPTQQAETSAG